MKFPLAIACLAFAGAAAAQDAPPQILPVGCNYDGGLTFVAIGRASAPEPGVFRVEVPGVDLVHVEATISPSSMHAYMPYAGPLVSPIGVVGVDIAPRHVDGQRNGNIVTVRFELQWETVDPAVFAAPGAISYVLVLNNRINGCQRTP